MYTLGINTNNECGKDYKEVLNNIKSAGFTNVMVAAKIGKFEDTIKYAQSLGLNIPYVHLSTSFPNDLWSIGPTNTELINKMCEEIEICNHYNIPIAVMHISIGDGISKVATPYINGYKSMKKIVEFAKIKNVKIAIENLDNFNTKRLTYLLDHIKDDNLGFCYDAGHHNLYEPNFNYLKKYKNRIFAIHIHDNLMDRKFGFDYTRDLHRLPFDGKIDFNKVCKNLAKTNYNNVIMLEIHKDSCGEPKLYLEMDNLEFLQESYKRAKKISELVNQARNSKN